MQSLHYSSEVSTVIVKSAQLSNYHVNESGAFGEVLEQQVVSASVSGLTQKAPSLCCICDAAAKPEIDQDLKPKFIRMTGNELCM